MKPGEAISNPLAFVPGIPQGSILGLLFFNLYVNDITHIFEDAKFIMYADNITILIKGHDLEAILNQGNVILTKANLCAAQNSMKLNPAKMKAVIFRAKSKIIKIV